MTLSQSIEVRPVIAPQVSAHSTANNTISVEVGNNFTLSCGYKIRGDPEPSIIWTKDSQALQNIITVPDTNGDYFQYHTVLSKRNQTLQFFATPVDYSKARDALPASKEDLQGKYLCNITNRGGSKTVFTKVWIKEDHSQTVIWAVSSICGILIACVCILGIFCTYHR